MAYLLKKALILCPESAHHGSRMDMLIDKGVFVKIAKNINDSSAQVITSNDLQVSIGWTDLNVRFGEPGEEYKEDLKSGLEAAKRGGFTAICLSPATDPPIDNKSQVEFLSSRSNRSHTRLYPIGTVSKARSGEQLSEMYDMQQSGAIAFSDDKPIDNSELCKLAMLYNKKLEAPLFLSPIDSSLSKNGQMNEGEVSTSLGLKGIPELAEVIRLKRDLEIAEYCDCSVHFLSLSSPEAIDYIHSSKLNHSCSVPLANLVWSDEALLDFNTNFKLMPPLRDKNAQNKLKKLVMKQKIDCISSAHRPQDVESKKCEFEYAKFGLASLETFLNMLLMAFGKDYSDDNVIKAISTNPRKLVGIDAPVIETGNSVDISIFDPSMDSSISSQNKASKAVNYPFEQLEMKGKVIGSIVGNKVFLAD